MNWYPLGSWRKHIEAVSDLHQAERDRARRHREEQSKAAER